MNGYGGKILRINLSNCEVKVEPTPESLIKEYLGGRGFAAYFLYNEIPQGVSPYAPENMIVLAPGPLSGTTAFGGGKLTLATKSPETNSYGDANLGGHLAPEIKYAGYDAIILKGKAEKPVYLYIENDKVELRDASSFWGKGSIQTETFLKIALGERYQVAAIGPGGENMVPYATLSHDYGRQAGRCGIGAVMGSKNLKAIAIRGTRGLKISQLKEYQQAVRALHQDCVENPSLKEWQDYGSAAITEWVNEAGAFPTRNFQSGYFENYKNISGKMMKKRIVINDKSCFACPVACGKYSHVKTKDQEIWLDGPEYDAVAMLGGNLGIGEIEQIAHLNYLCDEYGLDTVSTGNCLGFVMECFEKKLLNSKKTDGVELKFGGYQEAAVLIPQISRKEGFGAFLAKGVKQMAQELGKSAADFAMHIKGQEISGFETRCAPGTMLAYATSDLGANHSRGLSLRHDMETGKEKYAGKAEKIIELQHLNTFLDMLGTCRLPWSQWGAELDRYLKILNSLTGLKMKKEEALGMAEKVWNLSRAFFMRENGKDLKKYDMPPKRWLEEAVADGPQKGCKADAKKFEKMLEEYYQLRGWDKEGCPTAKKLKELGISVKELTKA